MHNAVAAWSGKGEPRVRLDGPELRVRPSVTLALALALHELLTNAAKYGALSNGAGAINIQWSVSADAPAHFVFQWQECGGPQVRAPKRRGFGSRLIEYGLAADLGGTVELSFDQAGVSCRIDAPLSEIREEDVAS